MKAPGILKQLSSFILPFTVTLVLPSIILYFEGIHWGWKGVVVHEYFIFAIGVITLSIGLGLLFKTIALFIKRGKGTLAPWAPTQKLVVEGPYKYVRNPMISGVLSILIGESLIFGSIGILILALIFLMINHLYFVYVEEPGLYKRFGEEYRNYRHSVPRWIPKYQPDQST